MLIDTVVTLSTKPRHATGDTTVVFDKINSKSISAKETEHSMLDVEVAFGFFNHRGNSSPRSRT
jgi:hypothetical protein